MRIVLIYFFCQIIFSNEIIIDLITTNDIHGVVQKQKAYFMNPEYPPTIIGGAALSKYLDELRVKIKTNIENISENIFNFFE